MVNSVQNVLGGTEESGEAYGLPKLAPRDFVETDPNLDIPIAHNGTYPLIVLQSPDGILSPYLSPNGSISLSPLPTDNLDSLSLFAINNSAIVGGGSAIASGVIESYAHFKLNDTLSTKFRALYSAENPVKYNSVAQNALLSGDFAKASENISRNASTWGDVADGALTKTLAKIVGVVGGAYASALAYQENESPIFQRSDGSERAVDPVTNGLAHATTEAVSFGAGFAAAWAGLKLGAAIGSVLAGPAAPAGALLGGAAGILAGTAIYVAADLGGLLGTARSFTTEVAIDVIEGGSDLARSAMSSAADAVEKVTHGAGLPGRTHPHHAEPGAAGGVDFECKFVFCLTKLNVN